MTRYTKTKRVQLEQIAEIAGLVRRYGSISTKELCLRVSFSVWTFKYVSQLVTTMYQDIEFDSYNGVWSAVAQTIPEKTVDPNSLDPTLQS